MTEGARSRIENGRQGRVLSDSFRAAVFVAGDAKRALGPSEHAVGLSGPLPQEKINLFAGTEDRNAIDVGMQMAGDAADGAHGDDAGEEALVTLENLEARFGPQFAALPMIFRAQAAQASYGGGLLGQILEAQACEGGGAGEGGGQAQ